MAEMLVEENFERVDGSDMIAILELLAGPAFEAEPTAPRTDDSADHWELSMHWLPDVPLSDDAETALSEAVVKIRDHFATVGKPPPSRVTVYDAEGQVIREFLRA